MGIVSFTCSSRSINRKTMYLRLVVFVVVRSLGGKTAGGNENFVFFYSFHSGSTFFSSFFLLFVSTGFHAYTRGVADASICVDPPRRSVFFLCLFLFLVSQL